jgi:hypothetical protein
VEGKTLFQFFYQEFINHNEAIKKALIRADTERLAVMMKESFSIIIGFSHNLIDGPSFKEVARHHGPKNLNIYPSLFKYWEESLINSVQKFDKKHSIEVELSWRLVVAPGLKYLEIVYDHPEIVKLLDE